MFFVYTKLIFHDIVYMDMVQNGKENSLLPKAIKKKHDSSDDAVFLPAVEAQQE